MIKQLMIDILERYLEDSPDLKEKYFTENKLFDFYPGDYVTCTYRPEKTEIYKVYGIEGEKIKVSSITEAEEFELIHPKFLKKINLNSKCVKILYSNK